MKKNKIFYEDYHLSKKKTLSLPPDYTFRLMFSKPITFDSFIRGCIYILIFVGSIALINYLRGVLLPFFIALAFAYLIFPLVKFIQEKMRVRNRVLSILLSLLFICAIIIAIGILIVPPFVEQTMRFKDLLINFVQYRAQNSSIPEQMEQFLRSYFSTTDWQSLLQNGNILNIVKQIVPSIGGLLSQTYQLMDGLVTIAAVLLYLFFILLDYEQIIKSWKRLLPIQQRTQASDVAGKVRSNLGSYFRGQSIIALCVGILFAIGFSIINFPMAIGLGLLIGLLNLVPYLQLVGFIPTILLAMLKAADTGDNFWFILLPAFAVFGVVQIIQDMILTPRIMGKAMGLNPAMMLLSLSVWSALLGFIGLIIGLPLTNIIMAYVDAFIAERDEEGRNQ